MAHLNSAGAELLPPDSGRIDSSCKLACNSGTEGDFLGVRRPTRVRDRDGVAAGEGVGRTLLGMQPQLVSHRGSVPICLDPLNLTAREVHPKSSRQAVGLAGSIVRAHLSLHRSAMGVLGHKALVLRGN